MEEVIAALVKEINKIGSDIERAVLRLGMLPDGSQEWLIIRKRLEDLTAKQAEACKELDALQERILAILEAMGGLRDTSGAPIPSVMVNLDLLGRAN